MNSKKPVTIKRSLQSQALPQRRTSLIQEPVVEPFEQPEIEQPEQPEPVIHLESVAELMNEFSGRYDG